MDERLDDMASAYVDGEATDAEVTQVEGDPELLARVEAFRTVAAEVASPVPPIPHEQRDDAIARALAAAESPAAVGGDSGSGAVSGVADLAEARARRTSRAARLAAVAAAVVAVLALVPVLANLGGDDDTPEVATRDSRATTLQAAEDASGDEAGAAAGGGLAATTTVAPLFGPLLEVGPVDTPKQLGDAATFLLLARGAPPAEPDAATVSAREGVLHPCVGEIGAGEEVGEVLAAGRGTYGGEPAVVVVYERADGTVAVVGMLEDGCRVVARG